MPCPPSWEELELMRIDRTMSAATRAIGRDAPHVVPSLEVLEALIARDPESVEAHADLAASLGFARTIRERGMPSYEGPRAAPGWPTAEDIAREEALARFHAELAAKIELALCVFGALVWRWSRDRDLPATDPLAPAIARERARHLEHRERERAERITELERELARAKATAASPRRPAGAKSFVTSLEAKLEQVRALDPETLCTNRTSLHG